MLRSLYSGVSGLRAHQTMMDTVGNDIANINTTGYKSTQVMFEDTLSQEMKTATAPANGIGGTNPAQVGLGVKLAAISNNFSQGALQTTGTATNMAIQGDGFFMVNSGGQQLYTRAGDFSFDQTGSLVTPDGAILQGWVANSAGVVSSNSTPTNLTLPLNTTMAATQTSSAVIGGNLAAGTASGTSVAPASVTMYDPQGTPVPITFTYTSSGANQWTMSAVDSAGTTLASQTLNFNGSGQLTTASPVTMDLSGAGLSATTSIDISGMTEYAGQSTEQVLSQNGSGPGSLASFSIGQDGTITGIFTNGLKQSLGQVALATFANPEGLQKVGDTEFQATVNSGQPQIGTPTVGSHGSIASGAVEMSNVDLGQEFTQLIVAQRGFEANSKVIKASDEILQDLVNMK